MVRRILLVVVILGLGACSPALAAFPGRDGMFAVQPVSGHGILLVGPGGARARRICTAVTLCGHPAAPRFAPNGRGIAFVDRRTGRLGVVAPDGTCLWCLLGPPLTALRGSHPAFAADGALTFVTRAGGGVRRLSLAGVKGTPTVAQRAGDAVTSGRGGLAIVRGGWIDVRPGAKGALRRLVRGGDPVWSPGGSSLAFVRADAVWRIGVRGRGRGRAARPRPMRLVAGSSPAWSPDGRRIAYLAPGGGLHTMNARGGDRRALGDIRGRSVDWGPRVSGRAPCSTGTGTIVAQSSTSVLREARNPDAGIVGWNGCVRLSGTARRVDAGDLSEDIDTLTASAVSGRFSALGRFYGNHYGGCTNYLRLVDDASGKALLDAGLPNESNACDNDIDSVAVDSSGFVAWHAKLDETKATQVGPVGISCPSIQLCIATDHSHILTTTDPESTSADWTESAAPGHFVSGVSCPTTSFCLATASGGVYTTTDPTGGPDAWTFTAVPGAGQFVGDPSCPTATFCAIADVLSGDAVLVSTNPSGGSSTWAGGPIAGPATLDNQITGLSCASASFCAATDSGEVLTTQDPASPSTWAATAGGAGSSISCPSSALCVADAKAGGVIASTNPTSAAPTWTRIALGASNPNASAVACPSAALCVATGGDSVYTSTDPGSPAAWSGAAAPGPYVGGVACAPAGLCVLGGVGARDVLVSTDPANPASYAPRPLLAPPQCLVAGAPCFGEALYVHDDRGTRVVDTAPAGAGSAIAHLSLSGNATTLRWTHDGQPRSLTLR